MITGASTADLAIVLVDARHGVVEQTRRHSLLVSLLGVPHLVICVNKMDLVDYDPGALRRDPRPSSPSSPARLDLHDVTFIPISALDGDNVVDRSANMAWYEGTDAAAPPRDGVRRERQQPDRRALPGAVRDPPADRRAPRLPRLRRPGRGRRAAPGRRRGRAALRVRRRRSSRSTRPTVRSTRPARRWRSRSVSPTTSTSRAAT